MNAAIGVWTLVLGGWVLPGAEPPLEQPGFRSQRQPAAQSGSGQATQGGEAQGQRGGGATGGAYRGASPRGQGFGMRSQIPGSPTDPLSTGGMYPLGPPTANQPPEQGASGQGGGSVSMIPQMPVSPQARPSPRPRPQSSRRASHGRSFSTPKPFDSFNSPSPISPWMDMNRRDGSAGVDNYNQFVQPKLQQQARNQQLNRQIRGLQSNARRQGAALKNIGRQTQQLQGLSAPQYYMNTGNYYPGLNGR